MESLKQTIYHYRGFGRPPEKIINYCLFVRKMVDALATIVVALMVASTPNNIGLLSTRSAQPTRDNDLIG